MGGADHRPLSFDFIQASDCKASETLMFFDMGEYRFDNHLASLQQRLLLRGGLFKALMLDGPIMFAAFDTSTLTAATAFGAFRAIPMRATVNINLPMRATVNINFALLAASPDTSLTP